MKNLHSWNYFYTTAGRDGRDKFQVCSNRTFQGRARPDETVFEPGLGHCCLELEQKVGQKL